MKELLARYPKALIKKASQIKTVIFDVDGVLTDGRIIYDDAGGETKTFNVKDGLIVAHLKRAGIVTGIISGRESVVVARRATELKLDFCHQGIVDKAAVFEKLVEFHKLKKKHVAFIGDDINDLPVLRMAGLPVCPSDAPMYVKTSCEFVTSAVGGHGVLRETGDLILAAQGHLSKIVKSQGSSSAQ